VGAKLEPAPAYCPGGNASKGKAEEDHEPDHPFHRNASPTRHTCPERNRAMPIAFRIALLFS